MGGEMSDSVEAAERDKRLEALAAVLPELDKPGMAADIRSLLSDYRAAQQTSGDLCEACGWRGKRGGECAFCESASLRAELEEARREVDRKDAGYTAIIKMERDARDQFRARAERGDQEIERLREAISAMDALVPTVMDALESDAQLDVRRAAFESIQEAYEPAHPWGAARAALSPEPSQPDEPKP